MENGDFDEVRKSMEIEVPSHGITPRSVYELTPSSAKVLKTRVGLILCCVVIGLIGLESLIMIVYFFAATYPLKSLAQPLTQESIQFYKEARAAVVNDVLSIGNLFLGTVLLPILTLLLGYMFGAREEKGETTEGD